MRYMLVNVSQGNLQVDLRSPELSHNLRALNRPGKVISLNITRGESVDLIPHFDGSVEAAHASVKYSRDVLSLLRPHLMHTYVCDDDGTPIDIDKLLGKEVIKKEVIKKEEIRRDVTKPDMGQSAVIAAIDQHEAEMTGEASSPVEMVEEYKKRQGRIRKRVAGTNIPGKDEVYER